VNTLAPTPTTVKQAPPTSSLGATANMPLHILAVGKLSKGGLDIQIAPRPQQCAAARITSEVLPWAAAAGILDNGARWRAQVFVDGYLFEQDYAATYAAALVWVGEKRNELRQVVQDE
jgi:hypothetical protein